MLVYQRISPHFPMVFLWFSHENPPFSNVVTPFGDAFPSPIEAMIRGGFERASDEEVFDFQRQDALQVGPPRSVNHQKMVRHGGLTMKNGGLMGFNQQKW